MNPGQPAENLSAQPSTRLLAESNTPWVSAYVLSQTLFCHRAGLIAHELARDDDGEEEQSSAPRLDWEPDYDEVEVNQALQQKWEDIWWACKYGLWWLTLCLVTFFVYEETLALLLAAATLVFLP
jgi:hypothetical protein